MVLSAGLHLVFSLALLFLTNQGEVRQYHPSILAHFKLMGVIKKPLNTNALSGNSNSSPTVGISHQAKAAITQKPISPPTSTTNAPISVFDSDQLDSQPELIGDIDFKEEIIDPEAKSTYAQILLMINSDGKVIWAYVESTTFSQNASNTLLDTLLKSRYLPGKLNGHSVTALMRIEIERSPGEIIDSAQKEEEKKLLH